MSALTWNQEFELPDGSYSVSGIQDYFKYIIKKHKAVSNNPSVRIYVNQIENTIIFRKKTGYHLDLFDV